MATLFIFRRWCMVVCVLMFPCILLSFRRHRQSKCFFTIIVVVVAGYVAISDRGCEVQKLFYGRKWCCRLNCMQHSWRQQLFKAKIIKRNFFVLNTKTGSLLFFASNWYNKKGGKDVLKRPPIYSCWNLLWLQIKVQ